MPLEDESLRRSSPVRSISAILPAQNEALNLVSVVDAVLDILQDVVPDYEVIIVDDGSTDATASLADELVLRYPEVRVIHHRKKQGYGSTWRSGRAAATKQYVFIIDADRQYNPAELTRFLQWNDRYDFVAGYRARRTDWFLRRILDWWFKLIVRFTLSLKVKDASCGFLLVRTSLFKQLSLESKSKVIHAELLYRIQERSALLREVGIRQYTRKVSKERESRPLAFFRAIGDIWSLRRRIAKEYRVAQRLQSSPPATVPEPQESPSAHPSQPLLSDDHTPPLSEDVLMQQALHTEKDGTTDL